MKVGGQVMELMSWWEEEAQQLPRELFLSHVLSHSPGHTRTSKKTANKQEKTLVVLDFPGPRIVKNKLLLFQFGCRM